MRAPSFNSSLLEGIPEGTWVALSPDHQTVLATGTTLDEALEGARDTGEESPFVIRVCRLNLILAAA